MTSRSEIARQDQASEQRRDAAVAHLVDVVGLPGQPDAAKAVATALLSGLIEAIEGGRLDIEERRRKGWQSDAKQAAGAIEVVTWWRDALIAYTPPVALAAPSTPVEPTATRDAQGIGIDNRTKSGESLDARLEAAFGPAAAPVRHIRTVLEPIDPVSAGGPVLAPGHGALCGGGGGSWTHRGGANCETCIATYDAEHGPYTGPVAYGNNPGGPITPTVARTIREEVEAEQATIAGIPVIIEPRMPVDTIAVVSDTDAVVVTLPNVIEPTRRAPRLRLTAAQVREHGINRQRGQHHRSVSQVQGFADCGTRAALSDLERPAWWNVGGKAFHQCAEEINRRVASEQADGFSGDGQGDATTQTLLWLRHFDAQIAEQQAATPEHPIDTWRAANRGSEHYDWWRVEGPAMVTKYVEWLSVMIAKGWRIATVESWPHPAPVIEYETHLNVGLAVPNLGVIDLALTHAPTDQLLVVDLKAGSSEPKDTFQLGVYGWSLLAVGAATVPAKVRGTYYRARKGVTTAVWPVLDMHRWPDVVQRYRDMDAIERQGVYMPNVTSFCGGCGVRDLCPAQAPAPTGAVDTTSRVG
ncbi:MAG: PD-(D/E)XK nuclease family protein [Chloroflexota bacterium]